MKYRAFVAAVLAWFCMIPSIAHGQQSPQLSSRLDRATAAAIAPIVSRAQKEGLPIELLQTKAAEGVLRKASADRIVAAVRGLSDRLRDAKKALAPAQTAELKAGAEAIALGVPPDMLKRIREQRQATSVAVPLAVLAQLVAQGAPPQRAAALVIQLLERGASTQQFVSLGTAIDKDIASGESVVRALDMRAGNILAALGPRSQRMLPAASPTFMRGSTPDNPPK